MSHNIFCLDTETTAGQKEWRVVQFAIRDNDWYSKEWLIKPPTEITIGTQAVHHITPRMVENCPAFKESEWYTELMRRIEIWEILVAHHAPFDLSILRNEGVKVPKYIDTCRVARHILNSEWVASYGLQYLRYALKLDEIHEDEKLTGYAHSALYDTIILHWLYQFLYEKIKKLSPDKDPVEVMLILTQTPFFSVSKMKYGKYKWKTLTEIAEIDIGYLHWMHGAQMKKDEFDRDYDLIESINKIINNRKNG